MGTYVEVLTVWCVLSGGDWRHGRGRVWHWLLVRVRYARWLLLGWLRVFGLCEFCGVRKGQGWGHEKDHICLCYRCWSYFD